MAEFRRYAVYYTAAPGPLASFGASWLGWDARTGHEVAHPTVDGLPAARIAALTQTPRRYGFHATLKPPFRLAPGRSAAALKDALRDQCRALSPVTLTDGLKLALLDGFLALIPAAPTPALTDLAAALVRGLDHFRAPLTEAEIARRRPERLTAPQRANLDAWGYPWVMDQFRFHMTLTGRLPDPEAAEVGGLLRPILTPLLQTPMVLDAVTLCGEDATGRCHNITRIPL